MNPSGGGGGAQKRKAQAPRGNRSRFPDRGGESWKGPLVDYKEIDLLRKFLTASSKVMSRKRAGTNAREQRALAQAIKRARFLALLPFTGT
jgi:small subunit ribosomal protein S18